jgi:hypothetical protein
MGESDFGAVDSAISGGFEDSEKGCEIRVKDDGLRLFLKSYLAHITNVVAIGGNTLRTSMLAKRVATMQVRSKERQQFPRILR